MRRELLASTATFIAKHEGLRLKAYLCPAGIWTIGYGDTEYLRQFQDPSRQEITIEKARGLLINRVKVDIEFLRNATKRTLTDNQIIALLSLIFNIGRRAFSNSTLLKKLNDNIAIDLLAPEILRWNKIGNNVNSGLDKRRRIEYMLFIN